MQEDPYSGLIGDSYRKPEEKDQFRLELQRMVTVSLMPFLQCPNVFGRELR